MTDQTKAQNAELVELCLDHAHYMETYNADFIGNAAAIARCLRNAAAALSQPAGEPVAWKYRFIGLKKWHLTDEDPNGIVGEAEIQPPYDGPPALPEGQKLWLWKNFVDGRPEYWAFDNPYPCAIGGGDPQTLGEPCGYAIFKESTQGRHDVIEVEDEREQNAPQGQMIKTLMRFYRVSSITDLVITQSEHIEKLQAKLPALQDAKPRNPRKG